MIDKALEELVEQIDVEIADGAFHKVDVILEPRSTGKINNHARKRFIERHIRMAIATNTRSIERFEERLT